MTNALRITIYEDGEVRPWDQLSGQEVHSINHTIESLWMHTVNTTHYIEIYDEYIEDHAVLFCYTNSKDDERVDFPAEVLTKNYSKSLKMVGDRIPITPPQWGVNPWGKVEVLFELVEVD